MAITKGKIRGNGRQLGYYFLSTKENEWCRILEVDGARDATGQELKDLLIDFSLNEQMTRSKKGIYHASINPEAEDAERLMDEDWLEMADLLALELGFENQRRTCVLQKNKQGRVHLHIAFERYDHEKGKMLPIDHDYRAQGKARVKMAQRFNLRVTPERNPNRPKMKETLTRLWRETADANSFQEQAKKYGYVMAAGTQTPYRVVDEDGISFNLARHLDKVKIKEVRERFKDAVLVKEKEAIAFVRTQQLVTRRKIVDEKLVVTPANEVAETKQAARQAFLDNMVQQRSKRPMQGPRIR